eukprot:TRINITY_DN6130_c0_g1_i2.p1 TRINITY_DN6130_c0_g1~~TRINITY_DN6130_c0_g1_i2.p1  ORF type:complete len:309 (-),score=76.87 TRINITY_DN6130_c0_g1_i2:91-1017(-)
MTACFCSAKLLNQELNLPLGCAVLDELLDGEGIPIDQGYVVEVVGEAASGKTQLTFQLAIQAYLKLDRAKTVFLSTESSFALNRLLEMMKATLKDDDCQEDTMMMNVEEVVDNFRDSILIKQLTDVGALVNCLEKELATLLNFNRDIKLVVLDSLAAVLRGDSVSWRLRGNSGNFLFTLAAQMKHIAAKYKVLVLVVNQVSDLQSAEELGAEGETTLGWNRGSVHVTSKGIQAINSSGRWVTPALGVSWSYCVNVRLFLSRGGTGHFTSDSDGKQRTKRTIHLAMSPDFPHRFREFVLSTRGLQGCAS